MVYAYDTLRVKLGREADAARLMKELVPLLAPLGWRLAGAYHLLTGPTRSYVNIWELPDAQTFFDFPARAAASADIGRVYHALDECLEANELNLALEAPFFPKSSKA
jgi:hypothetical protein